MGSWERSLQLDDISHLVGLRRKHFRDLEENVRRLDHTASLAMISGLIAYGWPSDELSKCQGLVAKKLGQYVDPPTLSQCNLLGVEASKENDNEDRSVDRDNALAAIGNGEQLSTLASVALGTPPGPGPSADCENRPLDLSSSHRMERLDASFTYNSPEKDVYHGSAVGHHEQCNPHHGNETRTELSMTDKTDLETPEIRTTAAAEATSPLLAPFPSPECFPAGE